jgi:hypothetical protein
MADLTADRSIAYETSVGVLAGEECTRAQKKKRNGVKGRVLLQGGKQQRWASSIANGSCGW